MLSRHPIVSQDRYNFTQKEGDKDQTFRSALYCKVSIPLVGMVYVFAVHFSYQREQQCRMAAELRQYAAQQVPQGGRLVILGFLCTFSP